MDILRISTHEGSLIYNYISKYNTWKRRRNFYRGHSPDNIVVDPSGYPVFHFADVEGINAADSNTIIIDNLTSGLPVKYFAARYDKSKHYIIFSCGTWDAEDQALDGLWYDLICYEHFIFDYIDNCMSSDSFNFYNNYYDFKYPKQYNIVSLTGRPKPTRDIIIGRLLVMQKPKQNVIKYAGVDCDIRTTEMDLFKLNPMDAFSTFNSHKPLTEYDKRLSLKQSVPIDIYNLGYLNAIIESNLSLSDAPLITEKTVKVLVSGMPFVMFAGTGHLKRLHELGFQTYNTLWDEGYDNIRNFDAKVDCIVELIQVIMNTINWLEVKQELQDIHSHNLANFFKLGRLANKEFELLEQKIKDLDE